MICKLRVQVYLVVRLNFSTKERKIEEESDVSREFIVELKITQICYIKLGSKILCCHVVVASVS